MTKYLKAPLLCKAHRYVGSYSKHNNNDNEMVVLPSSYIFFQYTMYIDIYIKHMDLCI